VAKRSVHAVLGYSGLELASILSHCSQEGFFVLFGMK
jgi:hypothetical protein